MDFDPIRRNWTRAEVANALKLQWKFWGAPTARTVMVERYWFGIHKVAGTAESASTGAANESHAIVKKPVAQDFSNFDFGETADQLHVSVYGASDQAMQHPSSDVSHSWNGLDLSAKPVLPTVKEGGGPTQAGSAPR